MLLFTISFMTAAELHWIIKGFINYCETSHQLCGKDFTYDVIQGEEWGKDCSVVPLQRRLNDLELIVIGGYGGICLKNVYSEDVHFISSF